MSFATSLLYHTLNGIQYGFVLFLIASGLTVIMGILNILNLTHGELFAIGAYLASSIFGWIVGATAPTVGASIESKVAFLAIVLVAIILSALLITPLGVVLERVFVKPIYERDEVYQLVLTFGLILVLKDSVMYFWGRLPKRIDAVYAGINSFHLTNGIGVNYPTYNYFVIVAGAIVAGLLFWFFNRTKQGRLIRATAIDREMATAIGVNTSRTFTLVFTLGAFLAGLAGALVVPRTSATINMGTSPLVLSFVILVIGGLGSLRGAFVAALLVGVLSRWVTWFNPSYQLAAPFAIMILILLWKPEGLFGAWGEIQ